MIKNEEWENLNHIIDYLYDNDKDDRAELLLITINKLNRRIDQLEQTLQTGIDPRAIN